MGNLTEDVKSKGKQAHESRWMDRLARTGLVAYGAVHLLIAWVAVQLAFGESKRKASSSGAFAELASQPFGTVALWALVLGLVLLVLWRLLEAFFGYAEEDDKDRLRKRAASVLKAGLYGTLALTALKTLLGDSGGKGRSLTGTVMAWPGGQWLVALAGLAVIAYAGWTAYRGWSEKFLEHLDQQGRMGEIGDAYRWFGKVGYVVKGLSTGLVGVLIVHAGWNHSGKEDKGLDDALRTVLEQPFGAVLLCAVAAGLACYGIFCLARAKHLDR